MKRVVMMFLIVLLSAGSTLLTAGGCSCLQPTGGALANLRADVAAITAQTDTAALSANLTANAERFAARYAASTRSAWAYTFGGKSILASAAASEDLRRKAAVAGELAKAERTGLDRALALKIERYWAVNSLAQAQATTATEFLYSVQLLRLRVAELKRAEAPPRMAAGARSAADANAIIAGLWASVPAQYQDWVTAYGPFLLRLAAAEVDAQIALLAAGDVDMPYRASLAAMTDAELLAEALSLLNATDIPLTNANAESVAQQKKAAWAFASAGFSIILGLIGL